MDAVLHAGFVATVVETTVDVEEVYYNFLRV
jgi:hypothetical protein